MTDLGQIIREIRHDAAALPTGELRTEIQVSLDVLDAVIACFYSIRPGAGNLQELISTTSDAMIVALTTALYVRELATRPAERVVARVSFSRN
jgi:hypothetical protein